jgi:hypothetical protein
MERDDRGARPSIVGQEGLQHASEKSESPEGLPVRDPKEGEGHPNPRHGSIVSIRYGAEDGPPRRRVVEIDSSIPMRPLRRRLAFWTNHGKTSYEWWRHLTQPFVLIFIFPAVAFAAWQWAFCLSALSVIAVSSSDLFPFPPYNFSTIVS